MQEQYTFTEEELEELDLNLSLEEIDAEKKRFDMEMNYLKSCNRMEP